MHNLFQLLFLSTIFNLHIQQKLPQLVKEYRTDCLNFPFFSFSQAHYFRIILEAKKACEARK